MTNAVVAFDPSKFATGIANMAKGAQSRVGFLKMGKDGEWSYGANETEIEADETVFVDPMGFVHGWQCWANTDLPGVSSELLGDIVAPMFEPCPPMPAKVPETGRPWGSLKGLSCVLGAQALTYSTTSVGGGNAIAALAEEFSAQYRKDPSKMIAEVALQTDSYKHKNKTFGRIYVPIFEVVGWHAALPGAAVEAPKVEAPKAPAKRSRKTA